MRVLIVEDDHTVRRGLAVALRSQGLGVHDTPDAAGALRALAAMPYDVVLLDLGLPDGDGITLLPQLRAHHTGPILVVSARRDQSDAHTAARQFDPQHLGKPLQRSLESTIDARSCCRDARPDA